jgi:hypothetical protein
MDGKKIRIMLPNYHQHFIAEILTYENHERNSSAVIIQFPVIVGTVKDSNEPIPVGHFVPVPGSAVYENHKISLCREAINRIREVRDADHQFSLDLSDCTLTDTTFADVNL